MSTSAATPYSTPSLTRIQHAINNLRNSLNQQAIQQLQFNRQPDSDDKESEGQKHGQVIINERTANDILSHTIAVKLAHDAIMRDVETSRKKIRTTEDQLLHVRLRLDNLQYEKRVLEREITMCRNIKSPKLIQTGVKLPPSLFEPQLDDAVMARSLKEANVTLQAELNSRKKLQENVEKRRKQRDEKQQRLLELKENLKSIPKAVRQIYDVVETVRNSVNSVGNHHVKSVGSRDQLDRMSKLPIPLYILAREAHAYRQVFDSSLDVTIFNEAVEDTEINNLRKEDRKAQGEDSPADINDRKGNPTSIKQVACSVESSDVYMGCGHCVKLEVSQGLQEGEDMGVRSKDAREERLRVIFRFLPKLGLVVVRAVVISEGLECDEYPTKDLRLLFPNDDGERSPSALTSYLDKELNFQFDATLARGRAFIWANELCGIECMPEIHDSRWPGQLHEMRGAKRFQEIMMILKGRLRGIVHIKRQVDWLMGKGPHDDMALGEKYRSVSAKISDFTRVSKGEWSENIKARYRNCDVEVWKVKIGGAKGLNLESIITIQPDYPLARPAFHMKMVRWGERTPGLNDREMADIERLVNEAEVRDQLGLTDRQDLLLGAQVLSLLRLVDKTEGLNDHSGKVSGRTRVRTSITNSME